MFDLFHFYYKKISLNRSHLKSMNRVLKIYRTAQNQKPDYYIWFVGKKNGVEKYKIKKERK